MVVGDSDGELQDASKYGILAVQTLRNNIMASTLLTSMAITLSSLVALLMTNTANTQSAGRCVSGDRTELEFSIKFFCILVCFLIAFLFSVQSIRYYSHASILINVPFKKMSLHHDCHRHCPHLTPEYVGRTVNRGSYFWSLGL
ncbi:hypothetical protein HYC85_013401 [Camellia sinensis]|uniref:Uncharacterized protein n=1 Tax=Camellia sinensis TaxID=4442 RepID=A0A7J7H6G6_CAMSI|nr:hypothetical protein HYC85_013401 [Camellia sinensis]